MLGMRYGYYPSDAVEGWRVDSLVDFLEDNQEAFGLYQVMLMQGKEPTAERKENFFAWWDKVPALLEKRLAAHGKRFLAGTDTITIADFKAFQTFMVFRDTRATVLSAEDRAHAEAKIAEHPHLARYLETLATECAGYVANRTATPL